MVAVTVGVRGSPSHARPNGAWEMAMDDRQTARPPAPKSKWRRKPWLIAVLVVLVGLPAGYYVYVRYVEGNFHEVVAGKVYRSAQPTDENLLRWSRDYGIKSILYLRGSDKVFGQEEQEARRLGLNLVRVSLSATQLPTRGELEQIDRQLASLPQPILIHCLQGADRTGLVSVMAAMELGGQDYDTARRQLTWRRLHMAPIVKVDEFLGLYVKWCAARGLSHDGWEQFHRWYTTDYAGAAQPASSVGE